MKRVRLEDADEDCMFWSAEQNRWTDVISAWFKDHTSNLPRGAVFALRVRGDMCMPLGAPTVITMTGGSGSPTVAILMPARRLKELCFGLPQFAEEVRDVVFSRCEVHKGPATADDNFLRDREETGMLQFVCRVRK